MSVVGVATVEPVVGSAVKRRQSRFLRSPKIIVGASILAFFVFIAIFGPTLAPHDASWQASTSSAFAQPPSSKFWLGTDRQQHDIFSQILSGGRSTMIIAFVAGIVASFLSILFGVTAGYIGGLVDEV